MTDAIVWGSVATVAGITTGSFFPVACVLALAALWVGGRYAMFAIEHGNLFKRFKDWM